MTPRRTRSAIRHATRVGRSAVTAVAAAHGTKTRPAASRSGSDRAPAAKREPSSYEVAADRAYAAGRREQHCPDCDREEAGGGHCSGCFRPMHPDEWTNDTAKSRAGRTARAARAAIASTTTTDDNVPTPRGAHGAVRPA
jgi:hypothetical protein